MQEMGKDAEAKRAREMAKAAACPPRDYRDDWKNPIKMPGFNTNRYAALRNRNDRIANMQDFLDGQRFSKYSWGREDIAYTMRLRAKVLKELGMEEELKYAEMRAEAVLWGAEPIGFTEEKYKDMLKAYSKILRYDRYVDLIQ